MCAFGFARSAADRVYSKDQAARGKSLYEEQCSKCHGDTLGTGDGSPELAGADFLGRWSGKTVEDLFDVVHKTMPTDDPGHLSTRQTADVLAYILSENKFPAGDQPLANDAAALKEIQIGKSQ